MATVNRFPRRRCPDRLPPLLVLLENVDGRPPRIVEVPDARESFCRAYAELCDDEVARPITHSEARAITRNLGGKGGDA